MLRFGLLLFFTSLVIVSGEKNQQETNTATKNLKSLPVTEPTYTTEHAVRLVNEPPIGKWTYSVENHTCIIVQFAVQMNFAYNTVDNKTNHAIMDLPTTNKTTVQGNCEPNNQNITISWKSSTNQTNSFTIEFSKDEKSGMYSLDHIVVTIDSSDLRNSSENGSVTFEHHHKQYPTKKDNSYRCLQIQKWNVQRDNKTAGYIQISLLQFQAFMNTNSTDFALAQDCPFDTPDYIPITVGCALAGLVVIVLVAYLVGRRRNQAQGYLSM